MPPPHPPLYQRLIAAARANDLVPYPELAQRLNLQLERGPDRQRLYAMLDEIGAYEYFEQRPILSALAVQADTGYPAAHFFKLARELDAYSGGGEMEDLTFFTREVKRVYQYWKTH